jgi:predicted transposase YbfD/YdcC
VTPTRARTVEKNKGVPESRTLESRPVAAEDIGFPFAAQVARVTRQHVGRKDETVGLITDLSPQELPAQAWLRANRQAWGIENGTHQRLDVSLNEDRCRVRNTNGLWILGMLRRIAISLYAHWRERQSKPRSLWLTDFQAAMGEDNLAKAFAFVTHRRPKLT